MVNRFDSLYTRDMENPWLVQDVSAGRDEQAAGLAGSYNYHLLKNYADQSAASFVYHFLKRFGKLFSCIIGHMIKL